MAEGNGELNDTEMTENSEEPMDISAVKAEQVDGPPIPKTEDYSKLIEYGLDEKVASKLDEIYTTGKLEHADLDERALDALKEFPVDGALAVLKQFLESNLEHVSNKSAYLCGVMKTYRQKSKLPSSTTTGAAAVAAVKGPDEDKIKSSRIQAILDRTGYTLDVTTGQRKYGGPPPNWEGVQPGSGCEVFVGKIPKDMFEDELIPLFEQCGKIWDLRLMMDPMTGQNRGYSFITYCDREGAGEAVKRLDNYEIKKGKTLKVNVSVPNLRLFVGNIPKNKSKEEIFEEFCKLAAGLTEVIIYSSPNEKKKNRGFCFLEYESHKAASLAKRRLGTGRVKVWGCDIIVDWADPQEEPDEDTMSKVKVLYVRNLTQEVSEEKLKETFENFGKVERVKKIKDYAFVHFEDRDNAIKAMDDLNGRDVGGAFVEVSLAKPPSDKKKKEEQLRARERRMMSIMQQRQGPGVGGGGGGGGVMMMPPARGRGGGRGPMGRDFGESLDYDYDYYGYGDYRGGYSDPYYDDYYRYEDYFDYGFGMGPRGRGRAGPDRARGRGGPSLRGRAGGPPARGRGAMVPRGRGVRGGRGANVVRGRGNLAGKRKFDGGHQNQGDSKRRYQNNSGPGWGSHPIPQQPLDGSSGADSQWYQDSYGQQW